MGLIYLDNASTTAMRPEVRESLIESWTDYGNPSSLHGLGRRARTRLEEARERISALLGASRREIIFTSGGTESNNVAILGTSRRWRADHGISGAVVCSAIEHSAVLSPIRVAGEEGSEVLLLGVTSSGLLDMGALDEALRSGPSLVSVMWANNEVGTIQPIQELAERCSESGTTFHTDAVQAFGRVPIDLSIVPCHLLSLSAHKIGGPTGVGALFVRSGTEIEPLTYGGGQEDGIRPGTESVAGAIGLALAAELAERERERESERLAGLRDQLQGGLIARIPGARVSGEDAPRLPNILNLLIPGVSRELLLMSLDLEGIAASSGSACRSGGSEPSHVLTAMGLGDPDMAPLRLSLGRETTAAEVEEAIDRIGGVVARVRELSGS